VEKRAGTLKELGNGQKRPPFCGMGNSISVQNKQERRFLGCIETKEFAV